MTGGEEDQIDTVAGWDGMSGFVVADRFTCDALGERMAVDDVIAVVQRHRLGSVVYFETWWE